MAVHHAAFVALEVLEAEAHDRRREGVPDPLDRVLQRAVGALEEEVAVRVIRAPLAGLN